MSEHEQLTASDRAERSRVDLSRIVLAVEGVLLLVVGLIGLATGQVAWFQFTAWQAVVVLVTGVLALLVILRRRLVLPFAALQLVGYLALYVSGIAQGSTGRATHWLFLGIAVLGVVVAMTIWAGGRRVLTRKPPY
ncbi:hypothetical protein [Kutzneria albida]|uniref:Uncharacterized protein n=1 Tax=Kutzneria albida DSM 43870 TaxID=1449976 RepID=W5WIH6_9PSEU|nr:hypothetical protein [Kutzneria albida]AHH97974.1 hypothetical protein KALB_4612 [Kutzneria albida DSM 43870]